MSSVPLWSTWVHSSLVRDHDLIYKTFEPFVNNDENFDSSWTFGNCLSSIRHQNNKLFPWDVFFNSIDPYLNNFLEYLEPTRPFSINCDKCWANVYYKGSFQESHDHSFLGHSLSAIYILDIDPDQEGGELVFEQPSFNLVKYSGLNIFKKWDNQYFVPKLIPGTLMIFPTWINHYVLPVKSDHKRITLAANFKIEIK